MKGFLLMVTFLTRIPIKYPSEFKEEDFIKGIVLMPLIGLLIGAILLGIAFLAPYMDRLMLSLLIVTAYIFVTGGLHIDGFADTIDGIFSHRSREDMLEIMRDSRVGTFGVIGIVLLLFFMVCLTNYIDLKYLIMLPVIGRSCGLLASAIGNYAREDGLGKNFIDYSGKREAFVALILPILISFMGFPMKALLAIGIAFLSTLYINFYIKGKIGGITGDTIGFIIESSQIIYMFSLYLLGVWIG